MSIHGRSILHLRQLETILQRDLAHVDLRLLRAQSGGPVIPDDVAMTWRNVLAATAPTLIALSKEITASEQFVEQRKRTMLTIKRVILVIKCIIILVSYIALSRVYSNPNEAIEMMIRDNIFAGIVIVIVIVLLMLLGVWVATMNDSYMKLREQIDSPLHEGLRVFKTHLADRMIVRIMWHISSGTDPMSEFNKKANEEAEDDEAEYEGTECDNQKTRLDNCEMAGIDPCSPEVRNQLNLAGVHVFIKKYCTPILQDMADVLGEIKDRGVDNYDQNALWKCVHSGVETVQHLVQTRFDTDSPLLNFDDSIAMSVVKTDVVGAFRLGAAVLEKAFSIGNGVAQGSSGAISSNQNPIKRWAKVPVPPGNRELCFAYCRASKTCTAAYYHAVTGTGFWTDKKSDVLAGVTFDGRGEGADTLMLIKARAPTLTVGGAKKTKITYDVVKGADGAGVAELMRADSKRVFDKMINIVKNYQYRLDVNSYKSVIDTELRNHYGTAAYDGSIAAEVEKIMEHLRSQIKRERLDKNKTTYIQPDRLIARIRAMPEHEIESISRSLAHLQTCTAQYMKMFPQFIETWHSDVADIVTTSANMALTIAFLLYLMTIFNKTSFMGIFTVSQMIQNVVVVFCIYAIVLIVMETLLSKMVDRRNHNHARIDENGQTLRGASHGVLERFNALAKLDKGDELQATVAASTIIADSKRVVEKYAQCNAVTHGQVKMPAPLSECMLYTVVALIFIAMAVTTVKSVSFSDRVSNIRMLKTLLKRIDSGDAGALVEADNIIKCAQPNQEVWDLFRWFGIFTFVTLTVWFVVASQNVASDYRRSLLSKEDCD